MPKNVTSRELVDDRLRRIGRHLSWALRHGPCEKDASGWTDGLALCKSDGTLKHLAASIEDLERVTREDDKSRFEMSGIRIRATAGWSDPGIRTELACEPVDWDDRFLPQQLFHGTYYRHAHAILEQGLLPICAQGEGEGRMHVHLAPELKGPRGPRKDAELLVVVDTSALEQFKVPLFKTTHGWYVTETRVPPACYDLIRDIKTQVVIYEPEKIAACFQKKSDQEGKQYYELVLPSGTPTPGGSSGSRPFSAPPVYEGGR
jgi:RNA:NAD 2'-phosphotransferase (TPT1/KptA family)